MITSVDRTHDGAWEVTAMLRDQLGEYAHSERFYGYTKSEAVELYKEKHSKNMNILDLWDIHTDCTHDWEFLSGSDGTMKCSHCGCYQN